MMMVKVEAREFRLKEIIEELEQAKAAQQGDSGGAGPISQPGQAGIED
jgi:hypothetical protein